MTGNAPSEAALYRGRVMHARLIPFRHRFVYRVFTMLLDLDALPELARRSRVFRHNRFGLLSFHDRDHGPRDGRPLRPWVEAAMARAGVEPDGGPIRVLCFPRLWGYVFNPLTIYFVHAAGDGRLRGVLYEVKNTFGDQHGYAVKVDGDPAAGPVIHRRDKGFYVSPFIGMASTYRFRLAVPDERLSVMIRQTVPEGELLVATLTGERRPFTDASLLRAVAAHPLMTAKVIAAIHWEALRLWLKGATFHRRAPPPAHDVSA